MTNRTVSFAASPRPRVRASRLLPALLGSVLIAALCGCTPRYDGPWKMAELHQPPRVDWVDAPLVRGCRSLYYAGEPYKGRATRVFAYYACPAEKRRVPGMVLVHGGGGTAFAEWAELWAKRGYAAIAMDLAGRGPDGKPLPDGGPDQAEPRKFEDIHEGLTNAWPYHAIAAVIRAHSLLRSLPEVDADRTGITGISWGGYLTCITAGLDDRFKVAVPVYGCGYLYEDSAWLPVFARLAPADRQLWIDNYDPSRYLGQARMPMLFVNGSNDFAYPLDSYQKSYRLPKGPRTLCVTVRMPHGHPPGWAPGEIGLFVDSVLKGCAPLARVEQVGVNGRHISARARSAVSLRSAALNYTTDSGTWQKREWRSVPAQLDDKTGQITAELPDADGITWFLTVVDERGATVSSEHQVN